MRAIPSAPCSVGGKNSVFVPMYGAPYVRDLDNNRRYGSLADLNNFHKLAYMAPALHSSSSIICEPMEIAVPKRHLHIIHSALKHSDKPFMGIVTSKERAEDTMAMAGIVFGEDYVRDNPVLVSITNCNSPLVWDATMLDAMKVYARHNQPLILAPFALCGASTSASAVGAVAQVNAEALAGVAFTQLLRPGSPQIYGQFMVTVDMKTGAPMGGTPEAAQMMYLMGALARKYKLPWRTSGFHVGSKLNDAQAGYEANMLMHAAILAGANYIWHSAGWLEAGLTCGYSKFATDCEQLVGWYKYAGGLPSTISRKPWRRSARWGPHGHFLGTQHTLEHFEVRLLHAQPSWTSIPSSSGRPKGPRTTTRAAARKRATCSPIMRSRSSTKASPMASGISSRGARRSCRTASVEATNRRRPDGNHTGRKQ